MIIEYKGVFWRNAHQRCHPRWEEDAEGQADPGTPIVTQKHWLFKLKTSQHGLEDINWTAFFCQLVNFTRSSFARRAAIARLVEPKNSVATERERWKKMAEVSCR